MSLKKCQFFKKTMLHKNVFYNFFNNHKKVVVVIFQKISNFGENSSRCFSKKWPSDGLFAGPWNLFLSSFTFFLLSFWRKEE